MGYEVDLIKILSKVQAPTSQESQPDGGALLTFRTEDDKGLALAKKLTRRLIDLDQTEGWTGERDKGTVKIRLGLQGATPPAAWTAKKSANSGDAKTEVLARVEEILKDAGIKAGFFNSGSVTQNTGIAVHDSRVPFGLKFIEDVDGELVACIVRGLNKKDSAHVVTEEDVLPLVNAGMRLFSFQTDES